MEKDRVPLLQSILLCFKPTFYPTVLRQSGWRSLLYLGLICLIVYGFLGYRQASVGFDLYEEGAAEFYEEALPDFHFENGEADYPPDEPHLYEEREGDKVSAVIVDTSGKTKELGDKYQAAMLITKTEIVTKVAGKEPGGTVRREAIPKTAERVPAKEFFIERMREQKPRAVMTMTFHAYLYHVVAKVILVALASWVLLLADKGKSQQYSFTYYFNVGCYSVTPFVLSAFARGGRSGTVVTWVSYGVSLMLFLTLAVSGLAKCRQEDARELQSAEQPAGGGGGAY